MKFEKNELTITLVECKYKQFRTLELILDNVRYSAQQSNVLFVKYTNQRTFTRFFIND